MAELKAASPRPAPLIVVASAYGAERIREDGHASVVPTVVAAGADGFEVRRELLDDDADIGELRDEIAKAVATTTVREGARSAHAPPFMTVYSVPDNAFTPGGVIDTTTIDLRLAEAALLGAGALKFQLGGASHVDAAALRPLAALLSETPITLLVENGQLPVGGTIDGFVRFFDACHALEAIDGINVFTRSLGMTFDIGNWWWAGEDPDAACSALAAEVRYIHCKGVKGDGARRFAVAPENENNVDRRWRQRLAALPQSVPRGLEFPIVAGAAGAGDDLVAATRRHLDALRTDHHH